MTSLIQAQTLADQIDSATQQFEAYMRPTLQDWIDFTSEHHTEQAPSKHHKADEYSFKEVDGSLFVFESDEFYYYGDYITDDMEIPFAFVDDPQKFKESIIESNRAAKEKSEARTKEQAQARVDKLKKELEAAERTLKTATSND